MDREELLARYAAGERDFRGVILQYISNLSCSEWWYCRIPMLIGCYMQDAVMEGCYFRADFIDCDWRNGQIISCSFDEFVLDRCDLRNTRWSSGRHYIGSERDGLGNFRIGYSETFDKDGVFHPSVYHYNGIPF